jgi:alkane 1-monooxygenase
MVGFLLAIPFALTAFWGPVFGGVFSFTTLFVALGLIPLFDWLMTPDQAESIRGPKWFFDGLLRFMVLLHVGLVIWGAWWITHGASGGWEMAGTMISVGLFSGAIGVTYAHELIHRRSAIDRFLGELILVFVGFGHFAVAHVHGHHRHVGTPEDPATAKKGQSLYSFFLQAVPGVFASSLKIKRRRTLAYVASTLLIAASLHVVFGALALGYFFVQGIIAILLTETVDYIEHYGLERKLLENGRYEPVAAHHSWDSDRWLTGKLMVHLQRHSDHHLRASKEYQNLELVLGARQLPTGYAGCLILALIPPLWRKVMDPRITAEYR